MELGNGKPHSHAPISEGAQTGEVTIDACGTALAGTNRFECFHHLSVHALDSNVAKVGDEPFG